MMLFSTMTLNQPIKHAVYSNSTKQPILKNSYLSTFLALLNTKTITYELYYFVGDVMVSPAGFEPTTF